MYFRYRRHAQSLSAFSTIAELKTPSHHPHRLAQVEIRAAGQWIARSAAQVYGSNHLHRPQHPDSMMIAPGAAVFAFTIDMVFRCVMVKPYRCQPRRRH